MALALLEAHEGSHRYDELRTLVAEAWRLAAPKSLVKKFLDSSNV